MQRFRPDKVVSLGMVILGVGLLMYVWQTKPTEVTPSLLESPLELIGINPVPIYNGLEQHTASVSAVIAGESAVFTATLSAQAIYAMDVPTASILLEKNPAEFRSPASTTKLMTALISLDLYEPNQVLTVVGEASTEGAIMGLQPGETITVENLLAGLLIQSGNDAAMVLANNHPAGVTGFVAAMNAKAAQLHLEGTQFTNPSGLDGAGHYSTARDLAILSREVMKNPVLMNIVKTAKKTVSDTSLTNTHRLQTTHELLLTEPGVIGVKTGTTELAGEVLITQWQRDGREILIVIMGSQNRYWETKQIYNWVFDHYSWKSFDSGTLN